MLDTGKRYLEWAKAKAGKAVSVKLWCGWSQLPILWMEWSKWVEVEGAVFRRWTRSPQAVVSYLPQTQSLEVGSLHY